MKNILHLALALTLCGSALLHAEAPANAPAEFPLTLADIRVRDPFILPEGGMYYLYAQGGNRANNDNGDLGVEVYKSRDLVHWSQPKQVFVRPKEGFWGNPPIWAPEVHKLDGAYYMFATFTGRDAGRGSQILRAESPEGPFVVVGDEANTPAEQTALDATPFIDPDGTHWMVYAHEWAQIKDGTYLAVKMKNDWSARIGDPVLLFKASQGPWVRAHPKADTFVTDGPVFHRMKNGKLVMIWSSFVKGHGYGMGQAISESGSIAGPWRHVEKPFFGGDGEDGGHAMIFRDFSGELLMALHQPNGGNRERAKIFRLKEDGDLLVVDGPWVPKANAAASSTASENLGLQSPNPPKGGAAELKPIPFEDQTPEGLLKARAELSFRRLQEPYFQWDNVSRVNFGPFPGDALGRTINGLTLLSQALNQPEPASLKEIMRRVPTLANPDGYLGPKLPESRANEDTMAGHNGYTYGLMEYALWTKDPAAKESLRRMVANLFVPARAAIAGYRETSEAKVDWHLSGGDVGQFFTTLDGMTRAYALVPSPEFQATIETAIERYRKLDLVGLSAQTHAMLSAATGILRWHEIHHRPEDLAFAEALYKQYRALAMTETFENYNWFNQPKWTEACGVIDSFILTVNLWRLTGRADYLEDAHLILFNGLLPGQLHNGGFGTGPCVGHATGACRTKMHSEAAFCCSMRGGEGIARAIQYSYFQDKDTVVLPFYSNGTATLRFAEGACKVRQETGYPHEGQARLEVLESQVNKEKPWRFFVPSWAVKDSFEIRVNGKKAEPRLADFFAEIEVPLVAGTVVEVAFQQERGLRPAVQAEMAKGATRHFDGPLLLGSATENAGEPLVPILDLLAVGGRGGEPFVYFPKQKSQPVENAGTTAKAGNLATGAQVFRRDMAVDKVPGEVGKLFGALKHDRALAIMGFIWPKPQTVRQVILQWPESGAMPKPEEVTLRWSDAGGLQTAAQPGIIGNGRQWVYTLGTAPEGVTVDNLVLAGKTAEGIPAGLAVPEVEIIGQP